MCVYIASPAFHASSYILAAGDKNPPPTTREPNSQPAQAAVPNTDNLPSLSSDLMVIDNPRPRRIRTSELAQDEIAASALVLFWGSQLVRGAAQAEAGDNWESISTRNYITSLEQLIPFRCATKDDVKTMKARTPAPEEDATLSDVEMEEDEDELGDV